MEMFVKQWFASILLKGMFYLVSFSKMSSKSLVKILIRSLVL